MWKAKHTNENDDNQNLIDDNFDYQSDDNTDFSDYDDYYNDEDIDSIVAQLPVKKKRNRRSSTDEYYVKGSELIEEIKKYQESKRKDAETRRCRYKLGPRRNKLGFRLNDYENLYQIFFTFKILPDILIETKWFGDAIARCFTNRYR